MTIADLRTRCAALSRELNEEYHRAGAGLQEGMDTSSILGRYGDLPRLERIEEVREALAAAPDDRRLRLLLEHLGDLYEEQRTSAVTDRLQNEEAAAEVEVDGATMPFLALIGAILQEDDPGRRRRLSAAREQVYEDLDPLFVERHRAVRAVAGELGFADPAERCRELGGLPLDQLHAVTRALLAETEEVYRTALGRLLAQHGLAPDEASWADLAYAFNAGQWHDTFAADELVSRCTRAVEAMGIDPTAGGRITFDIEPRPLKSPRAFCSPIEVPQRVVLVVRPSGGKDDYEAFCHELGHSLHFGHTDPALPWEFRTLGDWSVTESFAFLLEHLTMQPAWLSDVMGVERPDELARLGALEVLMLVRRTAAQLEYELELARTDDPGSLKDSYAERFHAATGVAPLRGGYLAGIDPGFYCARYLQGWLFEAALSRDLGAELGERWFLQPAAGERLRGLWSGGQSRPVGELFADLGLEPLSRGPLIERLTALLA